MPPNPTAYTTGDRNRTIFDGTYHYTYDQRGNRTARFQWDAALDDADSDGEIDDAERRDLTEYAFDALGHLTRVETATEAVDYIYNFEGLRVARHVDSDLDGARDYSEYFSYGPTGNDVLLDFVDPDGEATASAAELAHRYVWNPAAVDQLLAQEDIDPAAQDTNADGVLDLPGDTVYPLSDHLHTNRDWAGYDAQTQTTTIIAHVVIDSFGTPDPTASTGLGPQISRYLYTSQEWDAQTGLHYYDARWYDPRIGKFLSEDPIGFEAGDANLTRYVGNTATNAMDSAGLEWPGYQGIQAMGGQAKAMQRELEAKRRGVPVALSRRVIRVAVDDGSDSARAVHDAPESDFPPAMRIYDKPGWRLYCPSGQDFGQTTIDIHGGINPPMAWVLPWDKMAGPDGPPDFTHFDRHETWRASFGGYFKLGKPRNFQPWMTRRLEEAKAYFRANEWTKKCLDECRYFEAADEPAPRHPWDGPAPDHPWELMYLTWERGNYSLPMKIGDALFNRYYGGLSGLDLTAILAGSGAAPPMCRPDGPPVTRFESEAAEYREYWYRHNPEQTAPFSVRKRYSTRDDNPTWTTYDQYGRRHREYKFNDADHGPHQHNWDYDSRFPDGIRSPDLPIDE